MKLLRVLAWAIAAAVLIPSLPASAGKVATDVRCNQCVHKRDIKKFGIPGNRLKPSVVIGKPNNDGDLSLKNAGGTKTLILDGDSGDLTNPLAGNGLVKAWAKFKANGKLDKCWRCSIPGSQPVGGFPVADFTPLATDLNSRPMAAVAQYDRNDKIDLTSPTSATTAYLVNGSNKAAGLGKSGAVMVIWDNPGPVTVVVY
jgi:hypothetical protein